MNDFSQNGEQAVFLQYFGERKGRFLDIGANDGVTLSMSRALALLGWNGVCVEPSPSAFYKLDALYRFDENPATIHCINAAVTTQDGPIELYDSGTHLRKGDTALLSTTVPAEMERWKNSHEQFTKIMVRGITFSTLLKECGMAHPYESKPSAHPPNVARFDFITIDAEGADWSILRQIDLRAVGCSMLCIEVNQGPTSHITDYCRGHGLNLRHRSYENMIFAR